MKPKLEIKLNKENHFITKYGTTIENEIKPSVIYLRTKAKITPLVKQETYEDNVDKIKTKFNIYVNKVINENKFFDNNFLANIDISSKSVKFGKVSFLRYDVYLKPKIKKTLLENKKICERFSNKLDAKLIQLLNRYKITTK